MKFGVVAGYLSDKIHVGRLNKNGNAFVQKEDGTDMVLAAVAEYVMRNFDGGVAVDFPRLGLAMVVNVTPTESTTPTVSGNEEGT